MSAGCPLCGAAIVDHGRILIDFDSGLVAGGGKLACLTKTELVMFEALWAARPRVLDRAQLLQAAYGHLPDADEPEIKIIDVFAHKLRRKLAPLGVQIENVWGRGYRALTPAAPDGPAISPATEGAQG